MSSGLSTVKLSRFDYMVLILCTAFLTLCVIVSQVVFYRQVKADMVVLSNNWEEKVNDKLSVLQLSNQAVKILIENQKMIQRNTDTLEGRKQ